MSLAAILQNGLDYQQLVLSEDQRADLIAFVELLSKWNQVYNLTAVRDPALMVSRHILDSLTLMPYLYTHEDVIDLGSGGGLPAIPMAIVYPDKRFRLVDSNQKKTRFLVQAVTSLRLSNAEVIHSRVEQIKTARPADCITARAFAAPQQILSYADSLCAPSADVLLMAAKTGDLNLNSVHGFDWQSTDAVQVYNEAAQRHIIRFARVSES